MAVTADPRTALLESFLNDEHFRFRRNLDLVAENNEIELTNDWAFHLAAPSTPLVARMVEDFRRYCGECLSVFPRVDSGKPGAGQVVWELIGNPVEAINAQDHSMEAFQLSVSKNEIRITSPHERGLLHGTHYLEWKMTDRGGPFLAQEVTARKPAFTPRISNGVFINGYQTLSSPGRFSDEYLGLMSHYGVNGIHIYVDLWSVFKSETLPELNSSDFDEQIAALRAFNERTLRCGIDLYLHVNTGPLDENHPVFLAHPDVKGARVEIFIEEVSGRPWHNLCSGSPKVHQAYTEALQNLFSAAGEVMGMFMIIGGECFLHCFTRPANAANGDTNCPRCRGKDASLEVAHLVNVAARAVKSTGAHKALYAWPYSAHIWSAHDPKELKWIANLEENVSVLANFDCGDADQSGARFFDYNIKCIGPSETFALQAKAVANRGRPIFAKIESCTTPDAFFLPYLPLYQRWHKRAESMKRSKVSGFVGQWRFYGMNASPPEELQYRAIWDDTSCAELLRRRAFRDFGLSSHEADRAVEGWGQLSKAWNHFPYSALTGGERLGYMRGPFYLGPSHPLIFDVQDRYNLPEAFYALRGDLNEIELSDEERAELLKKSKPRYISDLLITLPFGVEEYLAQLDQCRAHWNKGMADLRTVLGGRGSRAQMELDVCTAMQSHLRSLANVVKFYKSRDILQNTRSNATDFKTGIQRLGEILNDEIQNAEEMLPVLSRDFRIGYGYCYGPVYDAAMVEAKITQCSYVRDVELPRFSRVIRFHVWGESP